MTGVTFPNFGLSVALHGAVFWLLSRTRDREKRLPLATELGRTRNLSSTPSAKNTTNTATR